MERLAEILLRYRWPLLLLLIALSCFFATQFRFLSVRSSFDETLPKDHPRVRYFEQFLQEFENPDLVLVGLKEEDVFRKETLEQIDQLTREIEKVPHLLRVTSITNVPHIRGTEEGIEVRPFLEEIPSSPERLAHYRSLALSNPRYVRNLLSPDGTFASINAQLEWHPREDNFRFGVARTIRGILERAGCAECTLTGLSVIAEEGLQSILKDLKTYLWVTPVLISLLLVILFRGVRGFLIPQTAVFLSVLWTLGLFFAFRRSFAITTTMLPVLVSVICLSDVIHIMTRYYEESRRSRDKGAVVKRTVAHMIPPCFLTSTTTAVGFGSLATNNVQQVREFGVFAFAGILFVYLLAITLTPILLSFLPLPGPTLRNRYTSGIVAGILNKAQHLVEHRKRETLVFLGLTSLLAVAGIFQIRVETQGSKFLDPEAPSIQGLHTFAKNMSGIISIEVLLEGTPGIFKEPRALAELDRLQQQVGGLEGVQKTHSMADLVKEINQVFHAGDAAFYRIPDRREQIAQYLLLLEVSGEQELVSRFVNDDFSSARLSARVASMTSADYRLLLDRVQACAASHISPDRTARLTGTVVLYATIVDTLTKGQIRSLGLAFLLITLMMSLYLRSIRIGLISMIPNLFPVLLVLGVMGWTGITLNIVTVMISSIALGIAVDDTIHYLARYRKELKGTGDRSQAMRSTMLHTGRAIFFTSIVMAGGFWVICMSDFRPNIYLGLLTGVSMVAALLGDLLLLPICVEIFGSRKQTSLISETRH
jgi:hydrophobe/amphiphile efflux-3 (HAE3) family protein